MSKKTNEIQVYLNTNQWLKKMNMNMSENDMKKLKSEILNYDVLIDDIYIHSLKSGNREMVDFIYEFGYDINKHLDFKSITKLLTDYDVPTFELLLKEGFILTFDLTIIILDYLEKNDVYFYSEFKDYFTNEYIYKSRLKKINKIRERTCFISH